MASPYIGEIRMFAGNFAPAGWALCQGQLLAIAQNDVIFTLIGTTYGGDGVNTFALPNLQSRVPIHQGGGFTLAQAGGEETVTLTVSQMPVHAHPAQCNSGSADSAAPSGKVWGSWGSAEYSDQAANVQMKPGVIGSAGGNQPHDNLIPYLVINFIISLFGIFPTQN
jgi:microcystin-dependent protein